MLLPVGALGLTDSSPRSIISSELELPVGHHYLRINPDVKQFLSKSLPEVGWIDFIVADLTEGGTKLSAVALPSTEHGPQVALYGDCFYAKASADKYRTDALWVFRVEPTRNPSRIPTKVIGQFEPLIDDRRQPVRDSVAPIFGSDTEAATDTEPARVPRLKPSPRLAKLLGGLPAKIRAEWRPLEAVQPILAPTEMLRVLRWLWGRYRLDRFTSPSPREDWLLRGRLKTDVLTNEERLALLALIDVGTLSSMVASSDANRDMLEEFLKRYSELVPTSDVRAVLWGAMLAGASDVELRDEVRSAVPGLRAVVQSGVAERAWTRATLDGLSAAAGRTGDKAVGELLQSVEGDTHPLLGIAAWAERLEVGLSPLAELAPQVAIPVSLLKQEPLVADAGAADDGSGRTATLIDEAAASALSDRARLWALGKCFADLEPFVVRVRAVSAAASALTASAPVETPEALLSVLSQLEVLSTAVRQSLDQLPPRTQLEADLAVAGTVHANSRRVLGEAFDPMEHPFEALSVQELADVTAVVDKDEALRTLPGWVWSIRDSSPGTPPGDRTGRAAALCESSVRRLVMQLLAVTTEYSDVSHSAISKVSPPSAHVAADEHFRLELEQLRLAAKRLHRVPEEHRHWVQLALARGDDEEDTLQLLDRFDALSLRLSPDTARVLRDDVLAFEDAANRDKRLHQYERAVTFFEESLGGAQDVTFLQLTKRLERTTEPVAAPPTPRFELSLDHNWVGRAKTRAPIVFVPHEDPNRPYGFVSMPVAVEATRRWDYHLNLDARVRTRQRGQAWHKDWDRHTPEMLDIGRQDWRKTADGKFVYTFELRVAIRRPERTNEAFEIVLRLADSGTRGILSDERALLWESVDTTFEPLSFDWPSGIHPDYVKAHPVGPQKRLARIEARINSGGSFAVLAPRRFGKTTLVEYLRTRATELGFACPDPVVCTSLTDDRGTIDLPSVWRAVAEALQSALQCTVSAELRHDLPAPHAFDRARRAAADAGLKGILLLFDESQLLFAGPTGSRLGDRLKDLLERHWMARTAVDMAPLLFGFIGLPSFASNIGVNFRNLLEPEEGLEMDEDDVNRIILGVTKNKLHTTRESRHLLAQVAPNLYLARILVEALSDRANRLQRTWVTYDDVAAVQGELARQLEQARQGNIASLIRDSLNDSPDINKWQPSPSYPVALALALARHEGVRGAQPLAAHARQLLNSWCDEQQLGSAKPHYREDDVRRHLERLGELGVFDRSDFRSRFVEAWLVGEAREGFPPSATNALVKGASTIVSVSELLEPLDDEGGQAKVFRFTRNATQYALRRTVLSTPLERNRFLETVATLKLLANGISRGEAGIQYVFDLDAVGFSEQDEMVGVHVYRWIDGHDLHTKVGQLPGALVAEIGMKLAIALQLLHRYRIIHRDLRPKNIVLAHETKDPILIDFGLARFSGGRSLSYFDNEFAAPEVSHPNPLWTTAADVYGLGKTLRALLQTGSHANQPLGELLGKMTAEAPADRPDTAVLPALFDSARARYLVDDQCRAILERIDTAVAADVQRRWYPPVVDKFKPTFRMLTLGLHADVVDRCAEMADFLNQVLEAYPVRRGGQQLKLGFVKERNEETGETFCLRSIDALHKLRVSLSHGDGRQSKPNLLRKLSNPTEEQLLEWVREGGDVIAEYLGIGSLRAVVSSVL